MLMALWGPQLWMPIAMQIATAPVTDFFEMLDSRTSDVQPLATRLVADDQDVMAIPTKIAA